MTTPAHLGGAYPGGDGNTHMEDCWGYAMVKYGVKSLLDIGCGYGHTLEYFSRFLVGGVGVDGWEEAIRDNVFKGPKVLHDYTVGPAPLGDQRFHLGWSAEFLEHVDIKYMPNYMADFRRCDHVIVTHALPGQHGHHHVSCFDDVFWVDAFTKHGFQWDEDETKLLRATDRWSAPWGRCALLMFHNKS